MKITKSQLKSLIKEEVSRFKKIHILENRKIKVQRELRILNEQWNPSNDYIGNYFIATAPMDEPGEVKAHVIGSKEYDEYSEAGWDVVGPYEKKEAELRYDKISGSNSLWNSMDRVDDREAERAEQDWMRSGDDEMNKPVHIRAIDDFHSNQKDIDSQLADVQKRKFRDSKDW